jgi:hypothetical protein
MTMTIPNLSDAALLSHVTPKVFARGQELDRINDLLSRIPKNDAERDEQRRLTDYRSYLSYDSELRQKVPWYNWRVPVPRFQQATRRRTARRKAG